jgi:hypothetical protein
MAVLAQSAIVPQRGPTMPDLALPHSRSRASRAQRIARRLAIAAWSAALLMPLPATAELQFFPSPPVRTDVNDVGIHTQVFQVTASDPQRVDRRGQSYFESRIRLTGVGFGGMAFCAGAPDCTPIPYAQAHFDYTVTGILRWPVEQSNALVTYIHGLVPLDVARSTPPLWRHFSEGDMLVSDAAIQNRAAYFAVNYNGVTDDGSLSATIREGTLVGKPVQPWEVTVVRDVTRAVQQLLTRLAVRQSEIAILSGHSMGGIVTGELIGGISKAHVGVPIRDGGNNVFPYDTGSPTIFQAGILMATGLNPQVVPDFPLVPMWTISGEADYDDFGPTNGQGDIRWARVVQQAITPRGETIADWISIQQVRNTPHNFPDVWFLGDVSPPPFALTDGDRIGPVVAAAIRNLLDVATKRKAQGGKSGKMARSNFGGRGVDLNADGRFDQIVYQQGATTTDLIPVLQDAALDQFIPTPSQFGPLQMKPPSAGHLTRWQAVAASIAPVEGLSLPWSTVRLGGYDLDASGAKLARPFADLCQRYGTYKKYLHLVAKRIDALEKDGVYLRPTNKDATIDPLAKGLFTAQGCGS